MSHLWVCLAAPQAQDDVRRAISSYAPGARSVFMESAGELRSWARDAAPGCHVAVGPLEEGMSSLNVAAAVVRDGGASEVVLTLRHPDEELRNRASLLGAQMVLELNDTADDLVGSLDEPDLPSDDIPTLVMDVKPGEGRSSIRNLPQIADDQPVQADCDFVPEHNKRVMPYENNRAALERREDRPARKSAAPIVVLVSGRGGVGKTSIVATMAHAAASWGMHVAALDLDLTCGNLYSCFGLVGPADLGQLAHSSLPLEEAMRPCGHKVSDRLTVWGPCERPEMADAVYPHAEQLLEVLAEQHDLVLVDTGTTFTDAVAQAAQQCDRLVLVVDGRPGSTAAQARLGGLAVRLGVARTRIARLANRCGRRGLGEPSINRAEVGLETARPLRVSDGGAEVADCMAEGKVQDLFDIGSKFAETSAQSLAKLLSELGNLPDVPEATHLLEKKEQRTRWTFGRVREAV